MAIQINVLNAKYRETVEWYGDQLEAVAETRRQVMRQTGNDPLSDFIRELAQLIREKFFSGKKDEELPKFWRIFFNIGELAGMLITLVRAIFLL